MRYGRFVLFIRMLYLFLAPWQAPCLVSLGSPWQPKIPLRRQGSEVRILSGAPFSNGPYRTHGLHLYRGEGVGRGFRAPLLVVKEPLTVSSFCVVAAGRFPQYLGITQVD